MKKAKTFLFIALAALVGWSAFHVLTPHEVMAHGRPGVPFAGVHDGFGHHHREFGMGSREGWMMAGLFMWWLIPFLLVGAGAIWLAAARSKRWIGWALVALGVAAILPKWVLILLALAAVYASGRRQARKPSAVEALMPAAPSVSTDWLDEWEKSIQKEDQSNGYFSPNEDDRSR
ncbi:hypothetical protein GS3922_14015 [Geobacillus subterraneus]|uniref:Uncharacterized protein n=2 Tax=Geobacillus TaxID=129337 RepID=A0ABN4NIZ9_9BACL|nr:MULTISPECIES: hypothetical protein [Geobacillus]AMX84672.1 hypothetical protein GS3922_14015 [Geobacillus subterraneus]KZS24875.1 hypothetical protein A5418_03985 [Geobacillus subterraneus]OXB85492.1 hypothetical protein B9L21_14085 [Geobacillus uzenensis]